MFLYHLVIEDDIDSSISSQRVLKEGLNHGTATKWYSRGANFFPDLTERFRPGNLPTWIDFKVAFGANLEPYEEQPYFRFPVFSNKILVFNFDISSDLFAHMEGYVEGLPSKEDLILQYWASMHTLADYLKHKPFNNPEVYIFEQVPAKLIDYIE
ncbi:hypothetical protein [Psychrobacillus sp. FSL K6-1267]|uniref:hypothetical protein n=1 Tax=Psychrobacillus sp. FSL K6-1267 TaxID=2921543 RepID=UPI0030F91956